MWWKCLLVAALVVGTNLLLFSQTSGEINGVVYDSTGAVIPGATVTVTNTQTNSIRTAVSNESGYYNFPALLPGLYNVKAEIEGFQSGVRNAVELQVQQTARIDFRLNVGTLANTVEVSAGAPLLNTENATIGTVIENKRIVDLPLNGRSFVSLVALSPNVITGQTANTGWASTRGNADRGSVSISVAGMRREYTYYSLDGLSNTEAEWNTYAFLPSIDALQEFKVQTGIYSAEFGRAAAQVNILTKSGSNELHGTVYDFLRNNKLDARPYAFTSNVPVSAPFKWNQYGFVLGGPIRKDRIFFMSNYEGFNLRNQAQQVFSVPSAAMRRGDFSELLPATVTKDPLSNNQPFPGNIIPKERLNGIALAMLQYYPLPNVSNAGLVNNYLALQNNTTDKNQFTQRIDWTESAKSSWFGRYSWQDESVVSPVLYKNGTRDATNIKQAMVSNVYVFSPTLVNEFRTGFMSYINELQPELAYTSDVGKELNTPLQQLVAVPPVAWGTPYVNITGFSSFGSDFNSPFSSHNHTLQWIDNLSWTHGTHSIKFGGEIRRDRLNGAGGKDLRGTYTVQNQATGYGFSDYMLGYLSSAGAGLGLAVGQLRATSQAYFVNDSWKVRPSVTIEAGLRYEYTPPFANKGDDSMNFIIPTALFLNPYTRPNEAPYYVRDCAVYGQTDFYMPETLIRFAPPVQVKCGSSLGKALVHGDKTNFAPRLGVAWSPNPNWTVRAGFGMFYAQDETNTVYYDLARNLARDFPQTANLTTHNLTFDHPFTSTANTCGVPSPPYVCVVRPAPLASDPDRRTPYVEQYELNIQRQLSGSTALEIGYLGSQGHRLERALVYNDAYPNSTGSPASRTAFPELGLIQIVKGLSKSNYNSGTAKLTRRLSSGLSYLASYTWSKSLDNGSGIRQEDVAFATQPQNGWCVPCEYGLSDFDSRHRFVGSVLYELPVGKGKRFVPQGIAGSVLGGWQLNSIISKSSGFPREILDGINRTNTVLGNIRPDAVFGVPTKLERPTTAEWFNIESVQLQPFGSHFGNVGRSTVTSPGVSTWDFSTLKNVTFTERTYLQFRFECFNCANHPILGDPGTTMSSNRIDANGFVIPGTGSFGRITSTRSGFAMRQLQLALKLFF